MKITPRKNNRRRIIHEKKRQTCYTKTGQESIAVSKVPTWEGLIKDFNITDLSFLKWSYDTFNKQKDRLSIIEILLYENQRTQWKDEQQNKKQYGKQKLYSGSVHRTQGQKRT